MMFPDRLSDSVADDLRIQGTGGMLPTSPRITSEVADRPRAFSE